MRGAIEMGNWLLERSVPEEDRFPDIALDLVGVNM